MKHLTALLVAGIAFTLYYLALFEITKNEGEVGTPALARSAAVSKAPDGGRETHAALQRPYDR